MTTRARTRAATAAAAAASSPPAPPPPPQPAPKSRTNTTRKSVAATNSAKQEHPRVTDPSDKENIKTTTTSFRAPTIRKQKSRPTKSAYCTCTKGDDGSPMIRCAECKVWYHFICVDLTEHEAEEINVYICPLCTQSTGRKTAMTWEGFEALDDCGSDVETTVPKAAAQKTKKQKLSVSTKVVPPAPLLNPPQSSEESDNESEDDYVAEGGTNQAAKSKGKRRLHHRSSSNSDSNASSDDETVSRKRKTKNRRVSRSRTPVSPVAQSAKSRLKRKSSTAESTQTPVKRKKTETATDDPVRKYCLGKLEEVFREVFFRYPHIYRDASLEVESYHGQAADEVIFKKLEDMSDEEKEALTNSSKRFAAELEQCVFDIYSEPDKNNAPHAGGKYKDRFRMLQFNLSKSDRTVIHQRIIKGGISPKEISTMSSTDLADEETKQHIKIAEKESLAQTILEKPTVPRAKITHKGFQDIEDVTGEFARVREAERQREREQEEEERREREKRERLKAVEKQRQRTQSLSIPPESPVVPSHSPVGITDNGSSSSSWGAPPPIPPHILQHQGAPTVGDDILPSQSISRPLFAGTSVASDVEMTVAAPEPELELADLINIDEDGGEQENSGGGGGSGSSVSGPTNIGDESGSGVATIPVTDQSTDPNSSAPEKNHSPALHTISGLGQITASPSSPMTPVVGVSPFSSTRPRGLSFDLNSLWGGPKDEDISHTPKSPTPTSKDATTKTTTNGNDVSKAGAGSGIKALGGLEHERVAAANDDDFDMFLEEKEETLGAQPPLAGPTEPEHPVNQDPEAIFETIQQCWTGKIHMPLDSAAPQSTTVFARQIGGRSLGYQSPWWKTLFPSEELRIDGRVATQSSSEFLTQVRLNPAKELIAVAFSAVTEGFKTDFKALTDYLKTRDRHGLIFPWGQRPKEWAPGRELYLIPLLSSEPLPLYIELLDELKIPKTRKNDYMLGIWILGRGKLNGPPPQLPSTTPTPVSSTSTPAPLPVPPPMIPNIPTLPPHLAASTTSLPHHLPNLTGAITSPPQPGLPPPQVNQAALAKEVASLSQDQIQNLLKTLSTTNLPFNLPNTGGPSQVQPLHSGPPPPPPPQWPGFPMPGHLPLPHGVYPPPGFGGPRPPLPPPPPPPGPPMDDRRDSYPPPHGVHPAGRSGGDRDRDRGSGWRGGREGRQHRGRGKHRGGGGGGSGGGGGGGGGGPNLPPRPVDSGWPRRPKGDDGGGRSPSRRW